MKRNTLLTMLAALLILSLACSFGGSNGGQPTAAPISEKRCGGLVCDGPENLQNCPNVRQDKLVEQQMQ